MYFDFKSRFLHKPPRIEKTGVDTVGHPESYAKVVQTGGIIYEQRIYDGTAEVSVRLKEFWCPYCGECVSFQSLIDDSA